MNREQVERMVDVFLGDTKTEIGGFKIEYGREFIDSLLAMNLSEEDLTGILIAIRGMDPRKGKPIIEEKGDANDTKEM